MSTFEDIKKGIPNNINIPVELEKLCQWTEDNGCPISGCFELRADDGKTIEYWLGFNNVSDRFGSFGAGASGEIYAFWKDDLGKQKIVHLGSEGGEIYILSDNFIDFLRLLAIGYDEIGFADMNKTVKEWNINKAKEQYKFFGNNSITDLEIAKELGDEIEEGINKKFQNWVKQEFNVKIPKKGNEITDFSNSEFSEWIEKKMSKHS